MLALRVREPWIRIDVVHDHRFAAAARLNDHAAVSGDRAPTGERLDTVCIGPADDELVAVNLRVMDAAGVEVLPEQADGDFLHHDWVLQASQLFVERDQELPLDGHSLWRRF